MLPKLKPTNCLTAFLASAFQAFAIYNVHAVADVTEGGAIGLTLLLEHWLHISPAISSFVISTACFLLGWKILGREFIFYSLIAVCGYSVGYGICEQFPPLWPYLADQPLLSSIWGAVLLSIGVGLTIRAGGATTGDDALAMSISHLTNIPIQNIYLVSDLSVLLLSLTYIPFRRIAYSLLTVALSGQLIGLMQQKRKDEAS